MTLNYDENERKKEKKKKKKERKMIYSLGGIGMAAPRH